MHLNNAEWWWTLPKGLKAINLTCMRWTCREKKLKQIPYTQNTDQECDLLRRLSSDMVDEFFFLFCGIHMRIASRDVESVWIFVCVCVCWWIIELSAVFVFRVRYIYNLICSIQCVCLSPLIKSHIVLLRSIAIIEATTKKIRNKLQEHTAYDVSLCSPFVLLVVNRDFFCGDLTVSYTLLLFTSSMHIFEIFLFFLV